MALKSVYFNSWIHEGKVSWTAIDYAIAFCTHESAHLIVHLELPPLVLPTAKIVPLVQALVETVNAERHEKAELEKSEVAARARISGINIDCSLFEGSYPKSRFECIAAARSSDCIILPKPPGLLSLDRDLVEALIFGAGRPVIVVPDEWQKGSVFQRIAVAWDGGREAARAVGDAMSLLAAANEVEIVCAAPDSRKNLAGSDIAQHLSRHCRAVRLTELPMMFADAGMTLRNYLSAATPDLLVMGAYGHPRLLEFVLGGVTSMMLSDAHVPVFYSH
jgi:nucleotide-binding universal stress UspA family protein